MRRIVSLLVVSSVACGGAGAAATAPPTRPADNVARPNGPAPVAITWREARVGDSWRRMETTSWTGLGSKYAPGAAHMSAGYVLDEEVVAVDAGVPTALEVDVMSAEFTPAPGAEPQVPLAGAFRVQAVDGGARLEIERIGPGTVGASERSAFEHLHGKTLGKGSPFTALIRARPLRVGESVVLTAAEKGSLGFNTEVVEPVTLTLITRFGDILRYRFAFSSLVDTDGETLFHAVTYDFEIEASTGRIVASRTVIHRIHTTPHGIARDDTEKRNQYTYGP